MKRTGARGNMTISFIGMSGAGKSMRSLSLEKEGFIRYSCDDLIEKELAPELKRLGYRGTRDVSRWMGQPYDRRYKKNSQKYLEMEARSLAYILSKIKKTKRGNVVVDTTGSVVYLPQRLQNALKKQTTVIYLKTPAAIVEKMIERYMSDPKPVIWGTIYKPLPGEKRNATLKRCYPKLLSYRKKLYEKMSDDKKAHDPLRHA